MDYLCLLGPSSGWILPALVKGLRVIKDNQINIIIATYPSESAMVVGTLLSLMTDTKLILDYRDPWTTHGRTYCKIFGKRINDFFERLALRQASALVFCSEIMMEDLLNALGKHTKASSHVISNGFHSEDAIQPLCLGRNRKNMIYAGNLYHERRIELLAKPLSQLLKEGSITTDSFCFHVFGVLNSSDKEVIRKYGLQNIIKEQSQVTYEQILRYLKGADILFLPSGAKVRYAIPFKFFDYLSVKRPVFAVAPRNSAIAAMMRTIDCGRLASIDSKDSILKNLRIMILEKEKYTFSGAKQYTWDKIAHKYVEVLDQVHGMH